MPRRLRVLAILLAAGAAVGVTGGVTYGAFFATTSNGSNVFSADDDWTGPTIPEATIARSGSVLGGSIGAGQTYFVYANVADDVNAVATVTADVSAISAGQVAVPLTAGGPWSIGGLTYGYRSASWSSDTTLTAGSVPYSLTATDTAVPSNTTTQGGFSVTIDLTGPVGVDVQTANNGATVGRAESGDTVTYTYSEPIEPGSVLAGWDGTATTVTVRLSNAGCAGNDTLTVRSAATQLPLGDVCLAGDSYVTGIRSFTGSTMLLSGNAIVVALGTPPGVGIGTEAVAAAMTWSPDAAATDPAGNACSAVAVAESGAPADLEF